MWYNYEQLLDERGYEGMNYKRFNKFLSGVLAVSMMVTLMPGYPAAAEQLTDAISIEQTYMNEEDATDINTNKQQLHDVDTQDATYFTGEKAAVAIEKSRQNEKVEQTSPNSEQKMETFSLPDNSSVSPASDGINETGVVKGKCGGNVNYEINLSTGKAVVSGSGAMADYEYVNDSPFYSYADQITSVEIKSGVTTVGALAFAFCFDIEHVQLPSTITSIEQWAFLGCVSLGIIEVPEQVKNIGDHALGYYCNNGKEGTYYNTSITILGKGGSAAETYATDMKITFLDITAISDSCGDELTWTLDFNTGVLRILGNGAMSDYNVVGSTNRAPYYIYHSYITSVILDEGVTSIGKWAFYGLENLEEVILPNSLTSIGIQGFCGCTKLQTVVLPQNLTTIKQAAFSNCTSLKNVTIPKAVTTIDANAFDSCKELERIDVDTENTKYCSDNGILYSKTKSVLMLVPMNYQQTKLVVSDKVSSLDMRALNYFSKIKYLIFEGTDPNYMSSYYQNLSDITIYCDLSKSGWQNVKDKWTTGNITWVDLSALNGQDTLSIEADTTKLRVGESTQLSAVLDPALAVDFTWDSSDKNVAVVSNTGKVNAVGLGTAQIRVRSANSKYSTSVSITVTGKDFSMPSYDLQTLKTELNYTSISTVTKQIVAEKLHGIYFLNGADLSFYSLTDGSYQTVYTFTGCTDAFATNDKLYVLYNDSSRRVNVCYVYDLMTQSLLSRFLISEYNLYAIGADEDDRIYVSCSDTNYSGKYMIFLLTETGDALSDLTVGTPVRAFSGFDKTNGCFYMESYYDYYSWGYSHPGNALTMGKVTENTLKYIDTYYGFLEGGFISRSMSCLLYLCQSSYLSHQTSAELLGGRYLTAVSVLHGSVNVYDSNTAGETGIKQLMGISRSAAEGEVESSYSDTNSIGVRAVYNENANSMIVYENNHNLTEYNLLTGEKTAIGQTKYNVFNMLKMGDSLIIIEKENNSYYMEIVDWGKPNDIRIVAEDTTMKVGTTQTLALENDKAYTLLPQWSSSDSSVLTVTQGGVLAAWKEGSAVITAKVSNSISKSITVTVTASGIITPDANAVIKEGAVSKNVSANNYSTYGKVVNSYIMENSDQTLTRVEYVKNTGVLVETYSNEYELLSSKVIPAELSCFGGFYSGKDANFLVFGQTNESESDNTEVMRIVKYSKAWQRQSQTSVKGANTYIPFDAGSLRMDETSDGKLYIHTCHEMYKSSDGLHHQANMTFVLEEASMKIEQSYYDVMNIAQAGYVSHSFNQFVRTDDKYVFRVDHGDANPRAVSLTRCKVDGQITNVSYVLPLNITTSGYNDTGVSVGGLELSSENCLIVGNSVDQTNSSTYASRNIFLSVTSKSLTSADKIWLTNYAADSAITTRTPHIVKLNEEQFLILWEEYNSTTQKTTVKMVTVDGEGTKTSGIVETKLRLSDCKPIMTSDGLVTWYLTDSVSTMFCVVNPYNLRAVNGVINISAENDYDSDDWDSDDWDSDEWDWDTDDDGDTPEIGSGISNIKGQVMYIITGKNTVKYVGGKYESGAVVIPSQISVGRFKYKVTSMAAGTFKNNKKITSVKLGNYITSIGKNTFKGCKKLKTVKMGTKISSIGTSAFENCSKLKSVTIGKNVKTVGNKAFYKCVALTKITIPAKVTKIGTKAFYGCKKLKQITIKSKKLKTVGKSAIKGINKKAILKVPKSKKAKYKKLFKSKTGFKKTMKIKS